MRRGVESLEVPDVLYQAMLVKAQVDNSSCAYFEPRWCRVTEAVGRR
jgi:hypothetical protein